MIARAVAAYRRGAQRSEGSSGALSASSLYTTVYIMSTYIYLIAATDSNSLEKEIPSEDVR